MNNTQISSPFSTGGGGHHFETRVQTMYVALMYTGGFAPCMPNWPITKIKLQGKYIGYNTDDMILYVEDPESHQNRKLLGQIKHKISIAEHDKEFLDVMHSAWIDFNNNEIFNRGMDAIVLITENLSTSDSSDTCTILEWAKVCENAVEFINKVELAKFSNQNKRNKLRAFRTSLKNANNGKDITDEGLHEFLKHFHLIAYDLGTRSSGSLSLICSLIKQHSDQDALSVWARLVNAVEYANENAGTIAKEYISDDLKELFRQSNPQTIQNKYLLSQPLPIKIDLGQHPYASKLVFASLIGGWDENNQNDLHIIAELTGEDYGSWILSLREFLNSSSSLVTLKNGKWHIKEREQFWGLLGDRVFDITLDNFKNCAIKVLSEGDPRFDLAPEKRFAASIYGKTLSHSKELRVGMAECLALLNNCSSFLKNCSTNKANHTARFIVRQILTKANGKLWGSLDHLLPLIAEAAPEEFLELVEDALQETPCPFDKLFSEENQCIFGTNYLTGLLWALELLAWEEEFLVSVCTILSEITTHVANDQLQNKFFNSLVSILLPWYPKTAASSDKQKAVIWAIQRENSATAWRLLLKLLPKRGQITHDTYKPKWRNSTLNIIHRDITHEQYREQVDFYSNELLKMSKSDTSRLIELITCLGQLPQQSATKILNYLLSENILNKTEEERLNIWNSLVQFSWNCKRFDDVIWASSEECFSILDHVIDELAPSNPLHLHRRLFNGFDYDLFETNSEFEQQTKKLEERRLSAIEEILRFAGINGIFQFSQTVENPQIVGSCLGQMVSLQINLDTLTQLLKSNNPKLDAFVSGYVRSRQYNFGYAWVDEIDKSNWSHMQTAKFLSYLPFTNETWDRSAKWLHNSEKEYWVRAIVNPYQASGNLNLAVDKLIQYGRPLAAIDCLFKTISTKQSLDKQRSITALFSAISSTEQSNGITPYQIVEIIKILQSDPSIDPNDLSKIEWAYLALLDRTHGAYPKALEANLSSDPQYFCELIQRLYRSRHERKPSEEVSDKEKLVAENIMVLLFNWKTPPGTQQDGCFSQQKFILWLQEVKERCFQSGHLETGLTHVGHVLAYSPSDPDGLWIDQIVANALNGKDAEDMRNGFCSELFNLLDVHWVDPTGKVEKEFSLKYELLADKVDNAGYQRLAASIRRLVVEPFRQEAERIVSEHKTKTD